MDITNYQQSGLRPYAPQQTQVELMHLFDKIKAVKAFVFDVDGVFTDNNILVTENGEFLRSMSVRDGQALKWAVGAGYATCIITGGRSEGVSRRFAGLGVEHIYSGISDKWPVYAQFLRQMGLNPGEVCYMGDDMPDYPIMRKTGLACCPADAVPEIIAISDYVSPFGGGKGCVRDLIEKVLKLQGKWDGILRDLYSRPQE